MIFIKLVLTLGFLFAAFSFLFDQFQYRTSLKKSIFNLLIMLSSIPLIYAVYTDKTHIKVLSVLEVGFAFNLTWTISVIAFLLGVFMLFINKK